MENTVVSADRPAFTGVSLYNDPRGLLSFWYASEWQLRAVQEPFLSVVLFPDPADSLTYIEITVRDLGVPLAADEQPAILEGVRTGLAQLPDCVVDVFSELTPDERWTVEWQCTFLSEGQRCRRRVRLFFSDQYQYAILCQGRTVESYAYWQGMFEFTMLTVGTAPFNLATWPGASPVDTPV